MGETDGLDNDEIISQEKNACDAKVEQGNKADPISLCTFGWGGGLVHYISVEAERAKIRLRMTYPRGETG